MLLDVFTDPKIVKVMHGSDSDIVWLQRDFGLYIVNLFDTGQATRVLGSSPSHSPAGEHELTLFQSTQKTRLHIY